jgi:hypothetical protein
MYSVQALAANQPAQCSPAQPWGIHPAMVQNACPRCGWVARAAAAAAAVPAAPAATRLLAA